MTLLSLDIPVAEIPKGSWCAFTFCASLFRIPDAVEERNPLSFEVPVAEMPKWLPGSFYISCFRFQGFLMQWRNRTLSLDILVTKITKGSWWLLHFVLHISGIPDAVEERTLCL
jgi:hypothetical protein